MPTPEQHLEQARANRVHAEYLLQHAPDDPTAMQWAVTAGFYCAVHCLQAYLVGQGLVPRSHVQRDNYLANPRYGVPSGVYEAYKTLKRRSEGARYLLQRFRSEQVRAEVLDRDLTTVTAFVGL